VSNSEVPPSAEFWHQIRQTLRWLRESQPNSPNPANPDSPPISMTGPRSTDGFSAGPAIMLAPASWIAEVSTESVKP